MQQQGQLQFEDKWPSMRPTVLKLLHQEPVSRTEWQDLFWYVATYFNNIESTGGNWQQLYLIVFNTWKGFFL